MAKRAQPSYYVPALEKGLDVLEALANADTPQSLADLARTLKRTSSELFRMIAGLEARSYIVRDPLSGGYRLTLKLYELAHTHSPVDHLLRAAEAPMRRLADEIHESCHLSVTSTDRLLVIAQAESPYPVRLSVEVGLRVLPLNTVSGRLLLAYMETETLQHLLEADPVYTAMSKRKRAELRAEFEKIRGNGFHMATSVRRTGLDASFLVGQPRVGVSAVLGVPFLAGGPNEGRERDMLPSIRSCARDITVALGLSSPAE